MRIEKNDGQDIYEEKDRECQLCGEYPHAAWGHGDSTLFVCEECALEILPQVIADAIHVRWAKGDYYEFKKIGNEALQRVALVFWRAIACRIERESRKKLGLENEGWKPREDQEDEENEFDIDDGGSESELIGSDSGKCESPMEKKLFDACYSKGIHLVPQVSCGKYRIDLAHMEHKIAVEVDGHEYHKTREQRTNDSSRQRTLTVSGWTVVRFTGSEIHKDVLLCVDAIRAVIEMKSDPEEWCKTGGDEYRLASSIPTEK